MFNTKQPQGLAFILKFLLSITKKIIQLLRFENLCFKLALEILDLREKLSILSSEAFDLLALLIKLLLVGNHNLLDSEHHICLLLILLFKPLLDLSSQSKLVLFGLFDSPMLLGELFDMLVGHFIPLLVEPNISLTKLFLMSSLHLFYLLGVTSNEITVLLLKVLSIPISHIDLMLKGSSFKFVLTFELFPFLLLFLDEKVMGTSLGLELDLFLGKL
jgi:hypothetical protein